jgi:hypothetical protein
MTMTVNDLITALEELAEAGHGDAEVRMAQQPSWPLQNHVSSDIAVRHPKNGEGALCVYLLDAGQVYDAPYAPAGIFKGRLEEAPLEPYCPECERTNVRQVEGFNFRCVMCGAEFDARDQEVE